MNAEQLIPRFNGKFTVTVKYSDNLGNLHTNIERGNNNTVDPSAPTNLQAQVRIPSTTSMLQIYKDEFETVFLMHCEN